MREQYTECQESDILNNTSKWERIVLERVEAFRLDVQPNFELPTHTVTVIISPTPTATNITAPEDTQAPNPTGTNGFTIFAQCLFIIYLISLLYSYCCSTGERRRGRAFY
ncbi:hypothetical protein BS50DRAFT_675603 [Corynespora cassiicola Philippines]|uniref:Uncharacterized protein n=1 Tax=Corynespora cassiicola Philippines TaxID=1448308 RepID=A0A2T2NVK0_CORCC|nr:hypothetical protein BS50DRAFT_675603 [Corynespora cassiicola Philippines]